MIDELFEKIDTLEKLKNEIDRDCQKLLEKEKKGELKNNHLPNWVADILTKALMIEILEEEAGRVDEDFWKVFGRGYSYTFKEEGYTSSLKLFELKYPILAVGRESDQLCVLPPGQYALLFSIDLTGGFVIPRITRKRAYKFTGEKWDLEKFADYYGVSAEVVKKLAEIIRRDTATSNKHILYPAFEGGKPVLELRYTLLGGRLFKVETNDVTNLVAE